ncbi:CRISPR-associated endonuclease Cas2 [candidate division KSB3 bacterium]|uniref:CRISPR-associated endoribonuclease Cas2 n=1 Tax=candidate division KSB3 bacterium TaxID=2044937 RepID=A0A2G6K8I9_9BACT|nr:MAG: CRISPR-associated endonuclease Cas2 [candidate division KSB3 bacterium]
MYFVLSYDIKNDRRRVKVHDVLKNYGERVQYSVFECDLSRKEFHKLREELAPFIDVEETDSLRIYRLCSECRRKFEHIGGRIARDNTAIIL